MKSQVDQALHGFLTERKREISFPLPEKCSMILPLAITQAASGANLSAFREVMDYDNLEASFRRTRQYEAAGTVWMLDPICSDVEAVSISQLEGAMGLWSEEAYLLSSNHAPSRRLSFDVALPVKVVDARVAQRAEPGKPGVCVAEPLTMLAGRAVVIAWYSAMSEALQQSKEDRVWCLFNAAVSVPIRMRLLPDGDASHLAALSFAEMLFAAGAAAGADSFWRLADKACRLTNVGRSIAKHEPQAKLEAVILEYGLTFKGKPLTAANALALKALQPFVVDPSGACGLAFSLAEVYFPELREATLLMRIGYACSARGCSDATAREYLVFVMNSLRVARLTGDIPKEEKLSVARVIGRDKKRPGLLQAYFKKKELVEYIFHEGYLLDQEMHGHVAIFETPHRIVQKFAASGAEGLVASHRVLESGGPDGMESLFALQVAGYREEKDPKTQAMIDVVWPVWSGAFDDEIVTLTEEELQPSSAGFLWHKYLNESNQEVGAKYRAFVAASTGGPIPERPELDRNLGLVGVTELGNEEKEELHKLQENLKQLRRKTVKFVALPAVGGATGAEFATSQMQRIWDELGLGHRFAGKKGDVRAFVASAELFPPNVVKQGPKARLSDQMAADDAKFKRVVEFFCTKRLKDDVLILFDGRGKASRRVIESLEDKLATSGSHQLVECWCVYKQPTKQEDPRAAARVSSYTINNREVAYFSLPVKGARKVVGRSEFNCCGETSSAATTYTGISMRRFSELPRMIHETKTSILGAPACASLQKGPSRLQADIDEKGHPFSYNEVKPISFWQTIMEHHNVTHVIDFTPGSGALAVAASGAFQYEGIAGNEAHRDWLDSIVDRCVMYKAGHEKGYAEQLGGDAEFVEKASRYFGGTMMEARRLLMPDDGEGDDAGEDDAAEESSDGE